MISIIVPVYNVAQYIEACMESLCSQTYTGEYEILLVDDCGTDDSILRAETVLRNRQFAAYTVLRHDHNRGLSAARNTGMDRARGEYILFVDSDDQLTPIALEKLHEKAVETQANVTVGAYETFGEGITPKVHGDLGGYIMAWNKLYRRQYLVDNHLRFVEGLVHEDNPWDFEVRVTNRQFATVSDVTYRYLIRENSLQTAKDYQRHFEAYCQILQVHAEIIERHHATDELDFLERQKALFFAMTQERGTVQQQHILYRLIREIHPQPQQKWTKADCHYLLPCCIGFYLYRKFHRYHLC